MNQITSSVNIPETFRILSFDPGLTCTGWCLSEYNVITGKLKVLKFGSIHAIKLASVAAQRDLVNKYGKRLITLQILDQHIRKIISVNKPDYVTSEDAFCNPRRITAFVALSQWLANTQGLLYKEFKLPLYKLAPKHIKRVLTGDGTSGKINIQKTVLAHDKIDFKSNLPTTSMNEHEADAIGINYTFVQTMLPGLLGSECFDKFGIVKTRKKK